MCSITFVDIFDYFEYISLISSYEEYGTMATCQINNILFYKNFCKSIRSVMYK
ncbi:unnamed protein product [Haemonchus placei]|uniref:Uncharacterized protein n=1 Tax=Haemonchus placei TaxID=6290 RepID=A0A0N4X1K6_HAEPC|nr:unnamed protein product [Haemonchus placei]